MDFSLSSVEQSVESLCRQILEDLVSEPSLRALDTAGVWTHEPAWRALAAAGLLGVAIPEEHEGTGAGLLALCLVLRELGRVTAPSAALSTLVMGALPIARYGSDAQKAHWLPRVAAGNAFLSAVLPAHGSAALPRPAVRAREEGNTYRLDGVCPLVSGLPAAQRVLVPTRDTDDRILVFLVDPHGPGASLRKSVASNGEPLHDVLLSDVRVDASERLGSADDGNAITRDLYQWTTLGICALSLGVAERALHMTARYTRERQQFGRAIGTFQAVSQRLADGYIELAAMRASLWQAAYRLGAGLPCERELAIAKLCAADGGHRIVATAQHVHAGVGFDRDYPLHRSFLWAKRLELMLGGASAQLARLGDLFAADADRRTTHAD